MIADLDFRARAQAAGRAASADTLERRPAASSALVDSDIAQRYFGGPAQPAARPGRRMNFAIRYLTEYRYDRPVTDNLNALRVKPATMATQSVEDFVVRVDPEARLNQHLDYFGTTVIEFGISRPHEHLSIDVRARVHTTAPDVPPETRWAAIEDRAYDARRGRVPAARRPRARRRGARRPRRPHPRRDRRWPRVQQLVEVIPDRFEYRAGVTYVGSTVGDLLDAGAGVCQDFAHLALLLLRRHGIGARYVSGYLWAPSGDDEASAEVETHAWVEALLPGGGRADLGRRSIPPTARSAASPTSRSATAATTPTCRRSRASTAARRTRS